MPCISTPSDAPRSTFFARTAWMLMLITAMPSTSDGQGPITAEFEWSTYMGGDGEDRVLCVATNEFGHLFVAGRTTAGLRLGNDTTGQSGLTHQDTFGGGASDGFLAKVAPRGSVLWCTYFGGSGDDEITGIVIDEMDGVHVVGNTTSPDRIATDTLCFQPGPGGGSDIFIASFTQHGLLVGATYFGGPANEQATGLTLDAEGRLVVCGWSDGPGGFPENAAPLQPWNAGTDGLVLVMNGTAELVMGTHVGGEGDDAVVKVARADSTRIALVGNTTSPTGIATEDALTGTAPGGMDAFLMLLDSDLTIMRGTYFGGPGDDRVHDLAIDHGRLAIVGETFSDTLYTDSTAYRPFNAGQGDGFLAVLDTSLTLQWATFFGDTAPDALTAVAFDTAGRLYAAGTTRSGSLSSNGDTLQGPADAFLLRSDSAQHIAWSRHVGAMDEEEAHALTILCETAIFLGGATGSTEDISLMGHQMEFAGGARDGLVARLNQPRSSAPAGICLGGGGGGGGGGGVLDVSPPLNQLHLCLGDQVTFLAYGGALGIMAEWMWYVDHCGVPEHFLTSGDMVTLAPTTSFTLYVRAEGPFNVTLCAFVHIVVHEPPEPVYTVPDLACAGTPFQLLGSEAESFFWAVGDTMLTGADVTVQAPMEAGPMTIQVSAATGPCVVEQELSVQVIPAPHVSWQVHDVTCAGGSDGKITADSTDVPGMTITWHDPALEGPELTDLAAGWYVVDVTDTLGCTHTDSLYITMPPALMDSLTTTPALCGGPSGTVQVHTSSTASGLAFDWGDGPVDEPFHSGLPPGAYTVTATDSTHCSETMTYTILPSGLIHVSIDPDTVTAENGFVQLQAFVTPMDSLGSLHWTPVTGLDAPTSPITNCLVQDTTMYVVHVVSRAGCPASDSVVVVPHFLTIDPPPAPCGEAFLPDIFSPDGNGLNDELCLMGGCFTSVWLHIYDRWGGRVFATDDPDACWDGNRNGMPVAAGTYVFTLTAQRSTGEVVERTGTITVRR